MNDEESSEFEAQEEEPEGEENLGYLARIKGEPGTGISLFFRFLAFLELIAGAILGLVFIEDDALIAVGIVIGAAASAALFYSLAVILENMIGIRTILEKLTFKIVETIEAFFENESDI